MLLSPAREKQDFFFFFLSELGTFLRSQACPALAAVFFFFQVFVNVLCFSVYTIRCFTPELLIVLP